MLELNDIELKIPYSLSSIEMVLIRTLGLESFGLKDSKFVDYEIIIDKIEEQASNTNILHAIIYPRYEILYEIRLNFHGNLIAVGSYKLLMNDSICSNKIINLNCIHPKTKEYFKQAIKIVVTN